VECGGLTPLSFFVFGVWCLVFGDNVSARKKESGVKPPHSTSDAGAAFRDQYTRVAQNPARDLSRKMTE
jgi:hypothetical protein